MKLRILENKSLVFYNKLISKQLDSMESNLNVFYKDKISVLKN